MASGRDGFALDDEEVGVEVRLDGEVECHWRVLVDDSYEEIYDVLK